MKLRALAVALVGSVSVFALSGCTSPDPTGGETPSSTVDTRYTPGSTESNPPETTLAPVKVTSTATVPSHVTAVLTKIEAIDAKATLPGEVSGPGLAITLKITNISAKDLDLTSTLLTMSGTSKAPGAEMFGPPARPLEGTIKPGESATGVFVFEIPKSDRKNVSILVTLPTVGTPVILFTGQAPS